MSGPFAFADELGPAKVIEIHDPAVGLKAALVIDNVACGPSIGGIRMAPDVTIEECFRLARAMTLKNAAASLPHGGGKAVIFSDHRLPSERKESLIRAMGRAIADIRDYIPGPDMGTDETCMAWLHDETGRAVGLPRELGGIPLDELGATAFGLVAAIEVAMPMLSMDLKGARVAVQGFGSVGLNTARFLADKGAVLVAASDSRGTVFAAEGLDVARLIATKVSGGSVTGYQGAETSNDSAAIIGADCDLWVPAARPDVITADNVDSIKARLVVQGANIPVTEEAEQILHQRGVVSIPDFVANAGGVICGAAEYAGASQAAAFQLIEEKVSRNVAEVLERSREQGLPPREVATAMARARVERAMTYRRGA